MRKNIFISIVVLIVLSFVLVQCTKENTKESSNIDNTELIMRSNISIGGQVVSPNCNIYDELPDIECYTGTTRTIEITTPNGCKVEVSMFVKNCFDRANDQTWIMFSDFEWHLATPVSDDCFSWYIGLRKLEIGKQNKLLDEFENYLEAEFERIFMVKEVVTNNLTCKYGHISAKFYKSPCTQRCMTGPSGYDDDPFFSYTTPCADDGCCFNHTDYCLKSDGTVEIGETYTIEVAPCTNFISVQCSKGTIRWGECKDDGCE